MLSSVDYVYIDNYDVYDPLEINGNVGYIHLDNVNSVHNLTLLNTQGNSAVTVAKLKIGYFNVSANILTLSGSSLVTVNDIEVDKFNIAPRAGTWWSMGKQSNNTNSTFIRTPQKKIQILTPRTFMPPEAWSHR